jgi:hypothetical protein
MNHKPAGTLYSREYSHSRRQATEKNPGVVDNCGKIAAGIIITVSKFATTLGTLILVAN